MSFDSRSKLNELLAISRETEWLELKEASNDYHFNDLGKYFSALSNEANLNNKDAGWLVFGVADNGHIVGTHYRPNPESLDSLKHEVAAQTSNNLTFTAIYETSMSGKRVLLFRIPPALRGMPTAWKGHFYGRDGESLVPLNLNEIEIIRDQAINTDWTASVCESATLEDLAPEAIVKARTEFKKKNPSLTEEIDNWTNETFLNKAKITINGEITNAAILLLGKPESEPFLLPGIGTITWILKDKDNIEQDYDHFSPPWLLNVADVYSKIRNLRYRHMPDGTLFPLEINQYDDWVFREALHNCIAHQDYSLAIRITLVEFPDRLLFRNAGNFLPLSVDNVINRDAPEDQYRNPFLASAMVNLNMIDTIGSGIKRMFLKQRDRFFPMPDYELGPTHVSVTILGRILDSNYVQHLSKEQDLSLDDVILLDKVQKGEKITQKQAKALRTRSLVEGRIPNLHISAKVAAISKQKAKYLHNRGLDEEHYAELVLEHIRRFGAITRPEADDLLLPKLPDLLNKGQKKNKVHRILSVVLKGKIRNTGSKTKSKYVLVDSDDSK